MSDQIVNLTVVSYGAKPFFHPETMLLALRDDTKNVCALQIWTAKMIQQTPYLP